MAIQEVWTVDGVNLSSYASDIQTYNGLDDTPAVDGGNVNPAQGHGEIWTRKWFGPGRKMATIYVSNADSSTGVISTDLLVQRQNFAANLDMLLRIFGRRGRLITVQRTLPDSSVRVAQCEVLAAIPTTRVAQGQAGSITVELSIPGAFWADLNPITSAAYTTGNNKTVSELAAATAPMSDLKYQIAGPFTSATVTDTETGSYFTYTGSVLAGQLLTVDASNMTVSGSSGLSTSLNNIVHSGDPRWLTLYPTASGVGFSFSAAGSTGATTVTFVGKRKYL